MASDPEYILRTNRGMFKNERIKSRNLDLSANDIPRDISFRVDINTSISKIGDMKGSFDKLKERNLICFVFKILLVLLFVSILGMFTPYISALIPLHESEICLCSSFMLPGDGFLW